MTGRTFAVTLAAWACGLTVLCSAQGYSQGVAPVVTLPPEAGGFGDAYGSPAFGDSGPPGGAIVPAEAYSAACPPGGYCPADCPPQPRRCWPCKLPALFITPEMLKPPRGAYGRLEYLNWTISSPGAASLGQPLPVASTFPESRVAPTDTTTSEGFTVVDPRTGLTGLAYVPLLEEIQFRNNPGLRATYGTPFTTYGTAEFSGWFLQQGSDSYRFLPRDMLLPGVGINFFPTYLLNVPGGDQFAFSYDEVTANYKSDAAGADVRFIVDSLSPPGEGCKLRPMFGVKYVGLQESLSQHGTLRATVTGGTDQLSSIESSTSNTILGATAGLRTELVHRWFVVGVQPAATLGGNIARLHTRTEGFPRATAASSSSSDDVGGFCPILEGVAYARVCLTDHVRFHVGYDALWLPFVYRASQVIDYRAVPNAAGGFDPAITTRRSTDSVTIHGLSLGLEYVF